MSVGSEYEGIRRALKLAMWTGQSVNVGLNRAGEAVKVEGYIVKVCSDTYRIALEEDENCERPVETIGYAETEYVEYS